LKKIMNNAVVGSLTENKIMDRVRENTAEEINRMIDARAEERVLAYASRSRGEITARIDELEREWSIERVIETEASAMGLTGLALGAGVNRKFFALPAFVASMVLLHAVQGWYPLLPLFRRMGIRTRREIDQEKFAMKTLRGDFGNSSDAAGKLTGSDASADSTLSARVASAFRMVRL
jgi:hypothetical protein